MKKLLALLLALIMLGAAACAHAEHYGWAFIIYDLQLSIEIDNTFMRTDAAALAQTNNFAKAGNVKPDLILEAYEPNSHAQLFIYCASGSPYDNLEELTLAYADDLGAVLDHTDESGTAWQILYDQEFNGMACTRILSAFQNVNAEYILMLSPDHSAYIITIVSFDGKPTDSSLSGITFGRYSAATETQCPTENVASAPAPTASPARIEAVPAETPQYASKAFVGLIDALIGGKD